MTQLDSSETDPTRQAPRAGRLKGTSVCCAILLLALATCLVLIAEPAPRVGDGAEYFVMTMALAEKGQPWSDAEVARIYNEFRNSHDGTFVAHHEFDRLCRQLTVAGRIDFPHFWFYSALAVPFYIFLKLVGGDVAYCFVLLHVALMGLTLWIAGYRFGRRGITVVVLLCLVSPALWFIDKGHTEFFTICFSTIGVIEFLKRSYLSTFVAFALVSTQNPPFAIVGLLALGFGLVDAWKDRGVQPLRITFAQFAWLFSGFTLIALHPIYYFLRHGDLTPQMITGAASGDFKGWKAMSCFVVDPDVGLLSNWPWLSVPIVAVCFYAWWWRQRPEWTAILFCGLSVGLLCWAQSKTNNFNHGGTVKISRYALWYIPFCFPLLYQFATNYRRVNFVQRLAVGVFLIAAICVNTGKFWPQRGESYLFQSTIAENLYDHVPGLYDPLPEIFIERCVRRELPTDYWAVSNRSGTKVIVHSGRMKKQQNWVRYHKALDPVVGSTHPIDPAKLVSVINRLPSVPQDDSWFYINLPGDIFAEKTKLIPRMAGKEVKRIRK